MMALCGKIQNAVSWEKPKSRLSSHCCWKFQLLLKLFLFTQSRSSTEPEHCSFFPFPCAAHTSSPFLRAVGYSSSRRANFFWGRQEYVQLPALYLNVWTLSRRPLLLSSRTFLFPLGPPLRITSLFLVWGRISASLPDIKKKKRSRSYEHDLIVLRQTKKMFVSVCVCRVCS